MSPAAGGSHQPLALQEMPVCPQMCGQPRNEPLHQRSRFNGHRSSACHATDNPNNIAVKHVRSRPATPAHLQASKPGQKSRQATLCPNPAGATACRSTRCCCLNRLPVLQMSDTRQLPSKTGHPRSSSRRARPPPLAAARPSLQRFEGAAACCCCTPFSCPAAGAAEAPSASPVSCSKQASSTFLFSCLNAAAVAAATAAVTLLPLLPPAFFPPFDEPLAAAAAAAAAACRAAGGAPRTDSSC